MHTVEFTHPEASGSITDTWSFTAADIACSESASLSAPAGVAVGGGTDPTQTSTSLSAASVPVLAPVGEHEIIPTSVEQALVSVEGGVPGVAQPEAASPVITTAVQELPVNQMAMATQTPPSVAPPAPIVSGGPLGCLPWGLACPRTIQVKQ